MSTQMKNGRNERKSKLGRRGGRSDAGYTLLLEEMSVEQWDAFLAGEIDADTLRKQVLEDCRDKQTDLGEWSK